MRCLLDSHTFLWFLHGDKRLGEEALRTISNIENEVLLSVASLWELAIKLSLNKLELDRPFSDLARQLIVNELGFLGMEFKHLLPLTILPFHHRDPFDRLLIAQAISEGIPILTADPAFRDYPVQIIW
jgi:PIN domain nuclease of toxin-antitoxin system